MDSLNSNTDQKKPPQNLYEMVVESASESIIITDQKGRITYVNPAFTDTFGYQKKEVVGQKIEMLIPKKHLTAHEDYRTSYYHHPKKRAMGVGMDLKAIKKGGTEFPVEIGLNYIKDRASTYVIALVNDISERKKLEETIEKAEKTAMMYLEVSKAMFLVLDKSNTIKYINEEGCNVMGYQREDLIGKPWVNSFIQEKDRKDIRAIFEQVMKGSTEVGEYYENNVITKGNKIRTIAWRNAVIYDQDNQPSMSISSGIDITDRKNLEKLKDIAMLEGIEAERKRIALDLHDGLVQSLSAVSMNLNALEKDMRTLPTSRSKMYHTAVDLLLSAIKDTRNISHSLLPIKLLRFGLRNALEDLINKTNKTGETQFQLDCTLKEHKLQDFVEVNIYRIIQELVQNILKHSRAGTANISLTESMSQLILKVSDNGIGFEGTLEEMQSNGIGMRNMVTRVRSMNGKLTLDSTESKGVIVDIEIPL